MIQRHAINTQQNTKENEKMNARLIALVILLGLVTPPAPGQSLADEAPNISPAVLPEAIATEADESDAKTKPDDNAEAEEQTQDDQPTPAPQTKKPDRLQFHLMDGTIITGKLTTKTLPVSTEFGDLTVPVEAIVSFAPGLNSHTQIKQTINKLIQDLANPNAKTRDQAQAQLLAYGPDLLPELQEHASDPDAERKVRIATLMEELYAVETDEFDQEQGPTISLTRLDQVVTKHFTVAGQIKQDAFTIASKFGELTVKLGDIKAVERKSTEQPEVRRTVEVSGMDMTCKGYKKTGIRVNRGDRVIITAEGRVTMTPWGSNSMSTPDGVPQNGMYNGKIPMGALAGRIGDSGEELLIGSKSSFVAKKAGTLQLGFAIQQNWANYQFPGSYKARVRIVPAQ